MHLLPILALAEHAAGSAFDEMLRLIGIAAIILAFFKGIRSLVVKPAPPVSPQKTETAAPAAKPGETAAVAAAPPVAESGQIAPEILAVISAAVASCMGGSHRVVSIKRQSSTWEKAGRQSVLSSHRIR